MKLTLEQKEFLREHASDDVNKLLLSASRFPDLNIPFLVEQILSRRQIKDKLPSWFANDNLVFPAKITAEQCSSEVTAMYKQRLVGADNILCDLTGGLGIDSFFFSRKVKSVIYMERYAEYCDAARDNFIFLGAENITVINEDSAQSVADLPEVDVFYIDPARRGDGNKRVYALNDCEPDLTVLLSYLYKKSPRVIAKISPMADIRQTMDLLPSVSEIHVISVKNECKELLFVLEREAVNRSSVPVVCVNYNSSGKEDLFSFTMDCEAISDVKYSDNVLEYLYEPNSSIMKAGAFKSVAFHYGLDKLHSNSHLYTSLDMVSDFPGRIFKVEEVLPFSSKLCKTIGKYVPKANIAVRNFPLSVDELRKKCKIKDGGDIYIFATTLFNGEKVFIRCNRVFS